jgi:hypothetical protein
VPETVDRAKAEEIAMEWISFHGCPQIGSIPALAVAVANTAEGANPAPAFRGDPAKGRDRRAKSGGAAIGWVGARLLLGKSANRTLLLRCYHVCEHR